MLNSSIFGNIGVPWMKHVVIYDNNQSYKSLLKKPNFLGSHKAYWDSSWFGVKKTK